MGQPIIERILLRPVPMQGLYHVSRAPINQHDLLRLIRDKLGSRIEIVANNAFKCDRSLDSSRFRQTYNYAPPPWDAMITGLAKIEDK